MASVAVVRFVGTMELAKFCICSIVLFVRDFNPIAQREEMMVRACKMR